MAAPAFVFPDGMRFSPTDEELVNSYLRRRVQGLPVFPGFIVEFDVYKTEPWNLPMYEFMYGKEGEFFYFTPRHPVSSRRRNSAARHTRRTAGNGFWEGNGRMQPIQDRSKQGITIGHKMALVFKLKDKVTGAVTKTDWIMHEYLLPSPNNEFQELALSRIYYNVRKGTETTYECSAKKKRRIFWEQQLVSELSSAPNVSTSDADDHKVDCSYDAQRTNDDHIDTLETYLASLATLNNFCSTSEATHSWEIDSHLCIRPSDVSPYQTETISFPASDSLEVVSTAQHHYRGSSVF